MHQDPLDVRPLLRRDAVLLRRDGGALIRVEPDTVRLDGADAYRMLAVLSRHLTGERSVREICARIRPAQRDAVLTLIRGLLRQGVVLDARTRVEPAVGARFRSQIEYLAHLVTSPTQAFAHFRSARFLLTGNGNSLLAAASGLLRNGAAMIRVVPDDEDWPFRDTLRAECARLAEEGVPPDLGFGAPQRADFVLHCADEEDPATVVRLVRRARTSGVPLLPVAATGGWVVMGPVTQPGAAGCWCCARAQIVDCGTAQGSLTPVVARMMGGAAAFEAFRALTGVAQAEGAVVQELRTLQSGVVPPSGPCAACGARGPVQEPAVVRPARRPDVRVVNVGTRENEPLDIVREYADAVHRLVHKSLAPPGFEPDWADRPAACTTYPAAPLVPLPEPVPPEQRPFSDTSGQQAKLYTLDTVAWVLRMSAGPLARKLRIDSTEPIGARSPYQAAGWRRGAISGGGLYPLEIYWVAGAGGPLPAGIYHYTPGHHGLERLTGHDLTGELRRAVRHPDADRAAQFLVISLRFWRSAFKYADLAYHVATMDLGALLGTWNLLGNSVGVPVRPLLWFADEALNALLGMDTAEESVLAVVPLPWESKPALLSAATPPDERPIPHERSRTVVRFAWSERVHRATVVDAPTCDRPRALKEVVRRRVRAAIELPDPDFSAVAEPVGDLLARRRSSNGALTATPLAPGVLGTVLWLTCHTGVYRSDLAPDGWSTLSVLANRVTGLAPGAYRYDGDTHRLRPAGPAGTPTRRWPERLGRIGRKVVNYDLDQAAAVIVISGHLEAVLARFGARGLRVLNAEVGAVAQAGYLAAAAAGIGCGAVLNLDHVAVGELLGFDGTGERALLCLLIGGERAGHAEFEHRLD